MKFDLNDYFFDELLFCYRFLYMISRFCRKNVKGGNL